MLTSLIFRLVPRLKSLRFMLHYPELVQDCKPDIVAATAACEEVRRSKKFGKLLEIILLIGNIMNTGSRNAESVGFDISYLPKLCNTKDRDNKSTLLHFLVETVEKNHPELLNFHEELMHLEKSARVSIENVTKSLKQMDNNIKNLETDLKNARNTDPDDRSVMSEQLCKLTIISFRFEEAMGAFCSEARSQCATLMTMVFINKRNKQLSGPANSNIQGTKMERLYAELSEYYVFDKAKYTLEEFFGDIKTFKDQFKQVRSID